MNPDSEQHQEQRQLRGRGIYLLPNLLTTSSLFAAFYSIVSAMNGDFISAAIAIFVATIADSLDGRIARMTNTQTEFGAEFDSLSDIVAFGLAPALVVYSWGLHNLGKFGWLAAFLYTAAGALRLARFNTQLGVADKRYFQGLPIPSAAAIIASMVWLATKYNFNGMGIIILMSIISILLGMLMVSNIRYYSFKDFGVKGRVPFVVILIIVLAYVMVSLDPPTVLCAGFLLYAVSGPFFTLWTLLRLRRVKAKKKDRRMD